MTAEASGGADTLLTPTQLSEVLVLLQGADSVELKLTVDLAAQRSALEALDLDPLGAQVRLVSFFDTPDLALQAAGVVDRILELSTKCQPAEAFEVAGQLRAFLSERGIEPSATQQTKTKKTLSTFAG